MNPFMAAGPGGLGVGTAIGLDHPKPSEAGMEKRRSSASSRRKRKKSRQKEGSSPVAGRLAPLTVGEYLEYLVPGIVKRKAPAWPPDVFALAGAVIQKAGAYTYLMENWPPLVPPSNEKSLQAWVDRIRKIAREWRSAWVKGRGCPIEVEDWWKEIVASQGTALHNVRQVSTLCEALLQLCAAADEASIDVGVPRPQRRSTATAPEQVELPAIRKSFETESLITLKADSGVGDSLSKIIHPTKLRVLPKLHTPQNGLTARSLSRYLSFFSTEDVRVEWFRALGTLGLPAETRRRDDGLERGLNLLILPWPTQVRPSQFQAVNSSRRNSREMPRPYGSFVYTPSNQEMFKVEGILDRAEALVGPIHGVLLPELALSPKQYAKLQKFVLTRGAFLVCGVAQDARKLTRPGKNSLRFDIPITKDHYLPFEQRKHHYWKLDKRQVLQYGLGSSLSPETMWCEDIRLEDRKLVFAAMRHWLTVSVLICEDLARPDPVGDVVRAVGPNLVIALLMDGPQLATRWAARYATVLADDPGCSVLSLTSIGMAELSRPPNIQSRSRVIALWKDAKSDKPVEIDLPAGHDGIVLSLTAQYMEEHTADGRSSHTSYPLLSGIHPVGQP